MSSKFFAWSKGDRRNGAESMRTGGLVNIGPEAGPNETDRVRSPSDTGKKLKRPWPLPSDQTPESKLGSGSGGGGGGGGGVSNGDTMPLHDAAIQSATSLLKAVDNMLRSPHSPMCMPLPSRDRGHTLAPTSGRPRSRTAPSTPLVEVSTKEPVELPGSFPVRRLSWSAVARSGNEKVLATPSSNSLSVHGGYSMMRTHSTPNNCSLGLPDLCAEYGWSEMALRPHPLAVAHSAGKGSPPSDTAQFPNHDGIRTPSRPDSVRPDSRRKRPPLPSTWASHSTSLVPPGNVLSQGNRVMPIETEKAIPAQFLQSAQPNREAVLIEQVSCLRAAQESHIRSIKDAHEKELASQRSYIEFLESQRIPQSDTAEGGHQRALTIDTSRIDPGSSDSRSAGISSVSLQSAESFGNGRKLSQERTSPCEGLRQRQSMPANRQAETHEQRQERDHLKDIADVSERRVRQLKDIVRKYKENEKGLRNVIVDLEGRLEHANNERLDVSEGYHEACRQISSFAEREKGLRREVEELQSDLARVSRHTGVAGNVNYARGKHSRTTSDISALLRNGGPSSKQTQITPQLVVSNNESHYGVSPVEAASANSTDGQTDKIQKLEMKLAAAESSADRLNSAFQAELRRQAREAGRASPVQTKQIEIDAFKIAAKKTTGLLSVGKCKSPNTAQKSAPEQTTVAVLEKELQYCIKELILSKLDVRTQKKSLHKAKTRMAELHLATTPRPPTPEWDSALSAGAEDRGEMTFNLSAADALPRASDLSDEQPSYDPGLIASGLGISPVQQERCHRPLVEVAEGQRTSASTRTHPRTLAVSTRVDKELPKTPDAGGSDVSSKSATTSPAARMQRTETSRSVSESIISSYAKRGTAKQVQQQHVKTSPCVAAFPVARPK